MISLECGWSVDPELGLVIGLKGKAIGSANTCGYLQADGRSVGLGRPACHRIVWEAVHGPIPTGLEINHRNGIKADNRITNLELVTHQENIRHAYATGLKSNRGEKHPSARLTEALVVQIRQRYTRYGVTAREIAEEMGVGRKCVHDAAIGKTWSHVQGAVA